MVFLTNINLNQNELQNAVVQPLAAAPQNPKLGQIYCNSVSSKIMWYNGSAWKTIGVVVESSATNGKIVVDGVEMSVYELPVASTDALGGVKVGAGLTIDANGVLSATGGGTADAVEWENVLNKPDDLVRDSDYVHTDNNFTNSLKSKLDGIATGAEANVNADWNAESGDAQILNKPTSLSAFTNDEGFIDSTATNLANYYRKSETYSQAEVNSLIGQISTIQISVVQSLPETGQSNIIYLTQKTTADERNSYDEYIWVASASAFEKIGDTEIDLTNYLQKNGDGSNVTAAFTQASSRVLPVTGEALAIIVGKVVKYLADLSTTAFSGSYNDLVNKPNLVKTQTLDIAMSATTNSVTLSGMSVLGVTVRDTVTNEVVVCDVSISGMTVTVSVASAPPHTLRAVIAYI